MRFVGHDRPLNAVIVALGVVLVLQAVLGMVYGKEPSAAAPFAGKSGDRPDGRRHPDPVAVRALRLRRGGAAGRGAGPALLQDPARPAVAGLRLRARGLPAARGQPTRGRISGLPMYGDPVGLATSGTLARTVRDAAASSTCSRGAGRETPAGRRRRQSRSWPRATASPGGCGSRASSSRSSPTWRSTRRCVAVWEAASTLLDSLGHEVEDIEVPMPPRPCPSSRPAGRC